MRSGRREPTPIERPCCEVWALIAADYRRRVILETIGGFMSRPQAYAPESGYRYQLLCRNQQYDRAWEHCDYAADRADKRHLLENYRLAYGGG